MTALSPTDRRQIHAYLDGQLEAGAQATFEARLALEPALAQALAAEQQFRQGLRHRIRQTGAPPALHSQVQTALNQAGPPASGWQRWVDLLTRPRLVRPYQAVVSALLLLALAGGLVYWQSRPAAPVDDHTVFQQLGGRHAVYLDNAGLLDVRGDPAEVTAWFSERLPLPLTAPTLPGGTLEGGRLGEFHHLGAAHLVYDVDGVDVSLTLFQPRESDFPAATRRQLDGLDFYVGSDGDHTVILWRNDEAGYALIAAESIPAERLLDVAVALRRQID